MKRARKYVSIREHWAAALAELLPAEQRDDLRKRKMPAKTVISLFEQHHNILHAFGGSDRWWNLTPMLKAPHRVTAARDTKIVAKARRIDQKWDQFMRATAGGKRPAERQSRWPKRKVCGRKS